MQLTVQVNVRLNSRLETKVNQGISLDLKIIKLHVTLGPKGIFEIHLSNEPVNFSFHFQPQEYYLAD